MSRLSWLHDRIDDFINPIVVKELRQSVRGRGMQWLIPLILVGQLLLVGTIVVVSEAESIATANENLSAGRQVFSTLVWFLYAACLLLVPSHVLRRLYAERKEDDVDLCFITTLSPSKIVGGKLLASLILIGLIHATFAPFITFCILLRGVDLPTIFVVVGIGLLASTLFCQFAIFAGCLPLIKVVRSTANVFMSLTVFWCFIFLGAAAMELIQSGIALDSWLEFWLPALFTVGGTALAVGLLFFCSVALLEPPTANRSLPVRAYATGALVVTGTFAAILSTLVPDPEILSLWLGGAVVLVAFGLLVSVSERDELSRRVRRSIPSSALARVFAFPFYTASANGIAWSLGMLILVALSQTFIPLWIHTPSNWRPDGSNGLALAIFAYGLTVYVLRWVSFLRHRISSLFVGVGAVLIAACVSSVGSAVFLLSERRMRTQFNPLFVLNPASLFSNDHRDATLYFYLFWFILVLIPTLVILVRAFRDFRRDEASVPQEPVSSANEESTVPTKEPMNA